MNKLFNIWNIARKEMLSELRDVRTFVFMLAFPIVLMLILGLALSNVFSTSAPVGDIKVLYRIAEPDAYIAAAWNGFTSEAENSGIHFVKDSGGEDGREAVMDNRYTGYAEVGAGGIRYYGSGKDTVESNIVQGMLTVFADRYNLAAVMARENPAQLAAVLSAGGNGDYIRETSVNSDKQPGSLDYYAVSMTTMIALYGAISASFLIRRERTRNTAVRLMVSPAGKAEIFTGKLLGSIVINAICLIAVMLFSRFVFNANWGSHYGIIIVLLLSEVLLAVSLGLGLSYMIKGEGARAVIVIFNQLASFFGGAYFPLAIAGGVMSFIAHLSPLYWVNTAMNEIIYADRLSAALPAIGINAGLAVLFLLIAVVSMKRREGL